MKQKLKPLRFEVRGRTASLEDMYYSSDVKDILSFSAPGCQFAPVYKQWLRTSREYAMDPDHAPPPSGWDGKISMYKNGSVGIGLLLGYKDKFEKHGFKLQILKWRQRPEIDLKKFNPKKVEEKYKYQVECVKAMRNCVHEYGGGLVVAATGTGKTKIAADFFKSIEGDAVFIVDQIDLLYQSQKEIAQWLGEKVGVVGNSKFEPRRITVATIQTLHKHQNTTRFRIWQKDIAVVLIDEVHVQMSRRNFDVVTSMRPQAVIGLTATLQMRKKNVALKAMNICGPIIFEFKITAGVKAGVLTKGVSIQIEVPENKGNRKQIELADGKWRNADDYEHHVVFNGELADNIGKLVKEALKRKYVTAVLVERVKHVERMATRLSDYKPRLFYGAIGSDERKKSIKHVENSKANLIVANKVFTKGINVKRLDLAIDCAMRKSKNDCIQKFGRLVRLHEQKSGAIYFSFIVVPAMKKAGEAQRSAFRANKIPFVTIKWTTAKEVMNIAERELGKL